MAVVWIQNQLRENKTKELILNYANQVGNWDTLLCLGSFFMIENCAECDIISSSNAHCSSVSVSLAPMANQLLIAIRSQRCQILHSP